MIPIRDANPTSRTPWVTICLIAANVIVFFTEPLGANNFTQARYFTCNAAIPVEITHGVQVGTGFPFFCEPKSVWLTILYSMFLHGGFLHIAGNMLYLWVFGNNVEDQMGPVRFIIFYLGAGLAATFAQTYVNPDSMTPMIGASGAIAGVLGAYLLMFPRARVTNLVFLFFFITFVDLPAVVVLGFWFLLQVFQGVGSVTPDGDVAYMAHVGGFVAGMLLLFILRGSRRPSPTRRALPGRYDPYA
jgi:rhomboid family protein